MSNTVITNYTDLNGPSTKADSSVVVIVNKDGSLSVDQKLLGTLMGTDGSQGAGISVVRVGHEGKPDDATDTETDDEKVPHVTLSVDSYYDEPNSIIKYDSGAEMLQSLRIETRENSLLGFQNDHCYTPLKSPTHSIPENSDHVSTYDESIIEISHTPPPKPVPSSKKITILEQQIIPKGKKILIKPSESPIIIKANDVLNKPLPPLVKSKETKQIEKSIEALQKSDESSESSSISSSGDSIPDRDSDSDYKDTKDRSGSLRLKKPKLKPRILKSAPPKASKLEPKVITKLKSARTIVRREIKEKVIQKNVSDKKDAEVDLESLLPSSKISTTAIPPTNDLSKVVSKQTPKLIKKEKKTPAHVTALLSDMTSLFSTPDVIRRVSTDGKVPPKTPTSEKEMMPELKKPIIIKMAEIHDVKPTDTKIEVEKPKVVPTKTYVKPKEKVQVEKAVKAFDAIPQLDDASLAQILQDTTIPTHPVKSQPTISTASMNSPSLAGPLSPTLDLLGGLQPEEEGLTEDFLMSVAQLVASSENLQEVIDKQVLGKVDTAPTKTIPTPPAVQPQQFIQTPQQQTPTSSLYSQTLTKSAQKCIVPRKDPIEIVRRDGRVITLPPIEAPATRSSKRKSQMETAAITMPEPVQPTPIVPVPQPVPVCITPEPTIMAVSKQYINKKLTIKKPEPVAAPALDKMSVESQESWNSEDDPYRLWCICKQPHNNRFMICCDGCEDWFHGKCVNITKAMGQQMEDQGIEWRCPNCIKKAKPQLKNVSKAAHMLHRQLDSPVSEPAAIEMKSPPLAAAKDSKTSCIVCKKAARVSSIYCSNNCIWKHAQDSLSNPTTSKGEEPGKSSEKQKAESRVIVYERKTGRLLAGPNAPTAENLKAWLQSNPTFEVVRPGTLNTVKPSIVKKKTIETNKIQTTLNFERIPRKSAEQILKSPQTEKERSIKLIPTPKMVESKATPPMKSPATPKSQQMLLMDTPKASTSAAARSTPEPRKIMRGSLNRSQSSHEKAPSVSPSTSRRKDPVETKHRMSSGEPIRDNVRKALQEQMSIRMAENKGAKFSEEAIQRFANDTEIELHELFRDVGMKYKAKYRSLMFNIKDRKNLTLWEKICDRSITPKQLVRLSPEELASQELAQWRDKEAKYQLELIKKSELDLLAASKTYVLKTHKGEEVMETKESVSTELDPNVRIEDVVTALNDSTVGPDVLKEKSPEIIKNEPEKKHSKKRNREDSSSGHSKKSKKDSKRESGRKPRSSRRRSDSKEKESKDQRKSLRRSEKKSSRARSPSKDRSKVEAKEKSDSERSRHRSSSREKSRRRSKSRAASRSKSQERERSRSRARSRRSQSRDSAKRTNRSRSKRRSSEEQLKLRSRSQDNSYIKSKHDSTDSDSIERPKSAMLKEAHPAYDPHEPMITSAFSEEDLRKSREDVFEENYRNEMSTFEAEYDASKLADSNLLLPLPETTYTPPVKEATTQPKASEVESDQEPTSTVENSSATVWSGCINMVDVARFYVAAHEVSGSATDLEDDLSTELDIVGRINPDTVWDYITKMKKTSNKDIVILRLQTANDEEKMQYIALYSYLSSRNRLGVVKVSNMTTVKDFYIVPVPANTTLPAVLLPLDGPGIGEIKTHLLIAIVIRQRKKRLATNIPTEIIPAKMSRKRSYTPPASPRRRALPLPAAYASTSLSTTVKDKIAASLVSADDDEPYSPGSSTSSSTSAPLASNTLRTKMEELNRQIEEQKQQILKMAQADSSVGGEDEAYSPSRPMTPPAVASVPLADIALPSNLQEILATIKQRSETAADVDMRKLPLP